MADLRILVSGAGIAGPVVAYFLAKAGARVTLIERAAELRVGGQNIDVRGHGLRVIQQMALEATVRSKTTNEQGLRFVDSNNTCKAEFPVGDGQTFTSDIEIMRGDLASILFDAAKPKIECIFGDHVSSMREDSAQIHVEFANSTPPRDFDIVIAADGWASSTRTIAFGSADIVKPLGQWGAWFTIPWAETDSKWARWYNAPGGRVILVRPDNAHVTRASIWIIGEDEKYDQIHRATTTEQKELFKALFKDAGWEAPRILEGMEKADDFYVQKIAQIKCDTYSQGRVVLVGDSCYCPTPVSGMGTTVALVGAYVLAGEIMTNPSDHIAAFREYEDKMKPFVAKAQKLAPGTPALACPQSVWGIYILHLIMGFVAWSGIYKLGGASWSPPASAMEWPQYTFA